MELVIAKATAVVITLAPQIAALTIEFATGELTAELVPRSIDTHTFTVRHATLETPLKARAIRSLQSPETVKTIRFVW